MVIYYMFRLTRRLTEHLQANGIVPIDKGRKRAAPPEDTPDFMLDNDDLNGPEAQSSKLKAEKRMQQLEVGLPRGTVWGD